MGDTRDIRERLENVRAAHLKEAERISRLLVAVNEAEHYLAAEEAAGGAQPALVLTPPIAAPGSKSASARIREALPRMPETFTSNDLWIAANNDGGRPIDKRKTFAPFFTKLKSNQEVKEIQGPTGNKPGIYRKGDKIEKD